MSEVFIVNQQYRIEFKNGKHLPFLNGVRGIAILMVIFFHSSSVWTKYFKTYSFHTTYIAASIAWTGVNLFFILSGMLITNILIGSKFQKNYFKNFYFRRFLKIVPLYYLTLIFAYYTRDHFLFPFHHFLFATNFLLVENKISVFPISWSLSLEEQFYLLWPIIIYFVSFSTLRKIIFLFIIFSVGIKLSALGGNLSYEFLYHSFITRLDGLALGSLVAFYLYFRRPKKNDLHFSILLMFLGFISVATLLIKLGTLDPFINPRLVMGIGDFSINILYVGFILFTMIKDSIFNRKILNNRVLLLLGEHSYALYLCHIFVIHYLFNCFIMWMPKMINHNFILSEFSFYFLVIMVSLAVSLFLKYVIENQFAKYKNLFNR